MAGTPPARGACSTHLVPRDQQEVDRVRVPEPRSPHHQNLTQQALLANRRTPRILRQPYLIMIVSVKSIPVRMVENSVALRVSPRGRGALMVLRAPPAQAHVPAGRETASTEAVVLTVDSG